MLSKAPSGQGHSGLGADDGQAAASGASPDQTLLPPDESFPRALPANPDLLALAGPVQSGTTSGTLSNGAALPTGSDPEITFISGVTSTARVAATSFGSWNGNNPATYSATQSYSTKWGNTTLSTSGTPGGNVTYWFDVSSNWTTTESNALASGLALWSSVANITFSLASSAASANFSFRRGSNGSAFQTFPNESPSTIGSGVEGGPGSGAYISSDTSTPGFGPIGGV